MAKKKKPKSKKQQLNSFAMYGYPIPKILFVFTILVLFAAGLFSAGVVAGRNDSRILPSIRSNSPQLLFVLNGDLNRINDRLVFTDVKLEWFTDRPQHSAGNMSVHELFMNWDEYGFTDSAPNAAFADAKTVVELTRPYVTQNGIAFDFELIKGEIARIPAGQVSIYIDATVNEQITDSVTQANDSDQTRFVCKFDLAGISSSLELTFSQANFETTCEHVDMLITTALTQGIVEPVVNQPSLGTSSFVLDRSDIPELNGTWICIYNPTNTFGTVQYTSTGSCQDVSGNLPSLSFTTVGNAN